MCCVCEVNFYSWNNKANQCVKKHNGAVPNPALNDLSLGLSISSIRAGEM